MIKTENASIIKITAKGTLEDITPDGFVVYDEKNDLRETLTFEQLKILVGKDVLLNFSVKEVE